MSIFFHNEDRVIPKLDEERIIYAIGVVCEKSGKKAGDINFIYCSDEFLLDLNKKYLEHDYYTDIITFNYNEGNVVSGDIFMSRDRIEDNAKKLGESLNTEFIRVCAHGVIHLLGQRDANEEEKSLMRQKEDEFIKIVLDA